MHYLFSLLVAFLEWVDAGLLGRKKYSDETWRAMQEDLEARYRRQTQLAEYRQRIADASHFLLGESWKDSDGKEEFVRAVYDGKVPQYLWYALDRPDISKSEAKEIVRTFWGEQGPGFGDVEVHRFGHSGVGHALRVRSPQKFAASITIGGEPCSLCQTGRSDQIDEPCVFFPHLFEAETAPAGAS